MPRPQKKGLDYFPFDVDFFSDIRIRKLVRYQGGKAVAVYALLLCFIYKNGYYIGEDEELPFIISEQTGYDEVYIREVIKSCLTIGLFSRELYERARVFTSQGIQRRYVLICKSSHRKACIKEYNLLSSEETRINSEETVVNSEKSTQSKVKERFTNVNQEEEEKEKEKKEYSFDAEEKLCSNFMTWWNENIKANHSAIPQLSYIGDHKDGIMRLWRNFTKEEVVTFCRNASRHPYLNGRSKSSKGQIGDFDWTAATVDRIRKVIENKQYLR